MTIEDFKGLMDDFDPASLLPELDTVMGKIALIARIVYIFASPKEANYTLGYRCYFGMGSVEAWRFTQKLAGIAFVALGLGLGIVMLLVSGGFAAMETMDLLWRAVWCMVWEAGLTAAACIAVNTVVMLRFDRKGLLRR